jgi:hypothetical protein
MADSEFEALQPWYPSLNTAAADEHVAEVERYIRTIKDSTRSAYSLLPYRHVPRIVLIHLVKNAVFWRNAFPTDDSITQKYSPRYILTGQELDATKHAVIEFVSYVQTHEEHSNNMDHRTMGCICLGPTGNQQGGHWFMSLASGERVVRYRWTELPIPREVIDRVSSIGRRQGMPSTLTYANRHGDEIGDTIADYSDEHTDSDDETYQDEDAESDDDDDDNDDDNNSQSTDSDQGGDEESSDSEDEDDDDDDDQGRNHRRNAYGEHPPDPPVIFENPGVHETPLAGNNQGVHEAPLADNNQGVVNEPLAVEIVQDDDEVAVDTERSEDVILDDVNDIELTESDRFRIAEADGRRRAQQRDDWRPRRHAPRRHDEDFLFSVFDLMHQSIGSQQLKPDDHAFVTAQMSAKAENVQHAGGRGPYERTEAANGHERHGRL